ncbi:MAG TPA: ATP-binding protein [Dongiaceae bacterium]|jgi:PAS domain S-box-containing protein|nr:ATP-binding protein [Dongiaceae bacterium]
MFQDRRTDEGDVLRAVIDTVVDGLIITDREGTIRIFNPAAEKLFGYAAQDVVGRNISLLMPHDPVPAQATETDGGPVAGIGREIDGRRKDGSVFPMSIAVGETYRGGELAYVGIVRDITEQKKTYAALTEARLKAEVANTAKTEFLSRMSHELRTPMNAIIGFAQLLQMKPQGALPAAQYADYLQSILGPARHLATLIDDILDIARIESGRFNIAVQGTCLGDVIAESIAITAALAERRGITVTTALEPVPPVLADPTRLTQCVVNLLTNAVKYNLAGGRVHLGAARIEGRRVRLTVEDTGIGIPEERIGELFLPFKRLHPDRQEIDGVGIGLALVKQLIEAMQGTVAVEPRAAGGTRFHLDLREAEAATDAAAGPNARPLRGLLRRPAWPPAELQEPKVALYVEDNPDNIHLMRTLFDTLPATELKIALNGESGLAIADAGPVDLIILDISLPGMDGFETMSRLKQHSRTAAVPVIGLSARASEQDRSRAAALGFYRYFTKPMNVPEFIATVRAVL